MTDETRDRPEEVDFGPGALDHRISLEATWRTALLPVFQRLSDPNLSWR